eukprot:COSAG02_NODE_3313_length_6953_cov_95.249635_5_plen_186_part_00
MSLIRTLSTELSLLHVTFHLYNLQEIEELQRELAAEAAANEAKREVELLALEQEREEMRLTLAQLEPEFLEQAAPVHKNAQKLERRAEAVDAVFEACVHRAHCKIAPAPTFTPAKRVPHLMLHESCTEQTGCLLCVRAFSRFKKRVVDIPAARAEQAAAAEATPPSADEPGPNDGNTTAPGFRKV